MYTTYFSGIRLIKEIFQIDGEINLNWDIFQKYVNISIDDFSATRHYIHGFSSYSFFSYIEKERNNEIKR